VPEVPNLQAAQLADGWNFKAGLLGCQTGNSETYNFISPDYLSTFSAVVSVFRQRSNLAKTRSVR
jgi:hypothetical protein